MAIAEDTVSLLVVDDEPDLREMLALQFRIERFRVRTAPDGARALDLLDAEPAHVVITDVRMPQLDGEELLDRLKAADTSSPVVIFVSAFADICPERAHAAGAEGLLFKPFSLGNLVQTVRRLMDDPVSRWSASPSGPPPLARYRLKIPDLTGTDTDDGFLLGRGGVSFVLPDYAPMPEPGQRAAFEIEVESGEIAQIRGDGIVRWVREEGYTAQCGIEFEHLQDPSDPSFLYDHLMRPLTPYIPSPRH